MNTADDYFEEMLTRIKGSKATDKKEEDTAILHKELIDEACDYVNAGLTLEAFYAKHKINVSKRNLLMRHAMTFNNLWKNY